MPLLSWAKSTFHLAVVAACGITASAVMFCVVKHLERSRAEAHFQQVAEQRLSVVRTNVAGALDTVSLLASYFEATGAAVDRQAFSTFVAPALAKHHYIQALEWIPRVERAARPEYERRARADGLHHFCFTEAQGAGAPVVAGLRDEYFPVFYVEPVVGNERAMGYNLACNPVRLAALQEARDSGRVVATARVTLVQEKGNQYGFLVFAPVYDRPHPQVFWADGKVSRVLRSACSGSATSYPYRMTTTMHRLAYLSMFLIWRRRNPSDNCIPGCRRPQRKV